MTDNLFWIHRDQIYANGLDLGFSVFSPGHIVWLLAIAVMSVIVGSIYVKAGESGRSNIRKGIGLSMILLDALKITVMGLFEVRNIEFLPLHLCSVGGLATLVYAMWPGKLKLDQLFGYAFFPAALLAIFFPSANMYPWWNFYCIHIFLYHALIIFYFVMLFMSGEFRPTYSGLLISFAFMAVFAVPIYMINVRFGVNYMFIGMRSDVGVLAYLWDNVAMVHGRLAFTLLLGVMFFGVLQVLHVIYLLIDKMSKTRRGEPKKMREGET